MFLFNIPNYEEAFLIINNPFSIVINLALEKLNNIEKQELLYFIESNKLLSPKDMKFAKTFYFKA